jgi:mono/diheme cytochrome c family protein
LLYQGYCVSCHGVDARGTGPLAESLPVPPADLTVLSLSNDGVFPSSRVMAKVYGYPDQFRADIMPEFGPLLDGPSVAWTDETGAQVDTPRALLALHDYLKSIQTP